ncbi:MAG: peptide-methionine (S)-S-oxide reductase MsrA [Clostridioides sp.]|jgi:peptide methionine sulfoxide reductase msrA/msrB|nr:peptide-methionine (S)-S-oxide reductase MsrA [Clostridioides sp.]
MEKKAAFAGGCFWCMVKPFDTYDGIIDVKSGYMGGTKENPTYEEVCTGETGHFEVIQIVYDDEIFDYDRLLDIYWKQVDPTDDGGQFADRGSQYRTAIFYYDEEQHKKAIDSKRKLEDSKYFDEPIVTEILPATTFYEAEEKHQKYYKKQPSHYNMYYRNSGRYNFVKSYWDGRKPNRDELKKKLTSIQFEVTQNDMTEAPFENEYYMNFEDGIYVDIVSGEVLFTSKDKFHSSCGWPAFSKPVKDVAVSTRSDYSMGMLRTEVRSMGSNSHLGHVFDDGPEESGGLRYCINSASLRFIPRDKMEEGYGEYLKIFED